MHLFPSSQKNANVVKNGYVSNLVISSTINNKLDVNQFIIDENMKTNLHNGSKTNNNIMGANVFLTLNMPNNVNTWDQ
jgi:hypothetical protein